MHISIYTPNSQIYEASEQEITPQVHDLMSQVFPTIVEACTLLMRTDTGFYNYRLSSGPSYLCPWEETHTPHFLLLTCHFRALVHYHAAEVRNFLQFLLSTAHGLILALALGSGYWQSHTPGLVEAPILQQQSPKIIYISQPRENHEHKLIF